MDRGKRCVVKQWAGTHGKVWVGGELWNATGNSSLMPDDETLIEGIDNLTLLVVPLGENIDINTVDELKARWPKAIILKRKNRRKVEDKFD